MKTILPALTLLLAFLLPLGAKEKSYARPAVIESDSLREFSQLSPARQTLITSALDLARKTRAKSYQFGGSSPNTGFDCSGAIFHLLKKHGLKPPRSSARQFVWLREADQITSIPAATRSLDAGIFQKLTPGDLVFWSGTYTPTDGRQVNITHVGLYLGHEKKDGRPVMICASEGRSYRRVQASGFGVFDFKIPSAKSRSKLVAYGSIPGLDQIKPSAKR